MAEGVSEREGEGDVARWPDQRLAGKVPSDVSLLL